MAELVGSPWLMIDSLQRLRWEQFLGQLRELEKLLAIPFNREQFLAKCVQSTEDRQSFSGFFVRLKGLRWEVIVKFCAEEAWLS